MRLSRRFQPLRPTHARPPLVTLRLVAGAVIRRIGVAADNLLIAGPRGC